MGHARRTARGAARSICFIGLASGLFTIGSTLVPGPEGMPLTAIRLVGVLTIALSALLSLLPWHRLQLRSTLVFLPIGLALVGSHNLFAAQDAYRYGAFFLVLYVWVGLWHPRGTALASSPFAAVAYVLPLVLGEAPDHAPWTVVYALPLYVMVGEVIASRSSRLDGALTRLEQTARTDPLTELPNRTVIERSLATEDSPFSSGALVYLDVDDFKLVNDTLGHAGGDEVLRAVAAALRHAVRAEDVPLRIAGDEFALLLAGPVTPEEVLDITRRITARLEAVQVTGGPVTMSIGVAWCCGGSADDLLSAADSAMYRAKVAGKAGVVLAT